MAERYAMTELLDFARALLEGAGLAPDRAAAVAEILLEGDLLGHSTHGLQLLAPYLQEIDAGNMRLDGEPESIADHGAAMTWDGHYLPGPWLVTQAMEQAMARLAEHPVMTVVIRRSHHVACLAAYLKRATDRGLVMLLLSSDPKGASVAPHGGVAGVFTPNPIAVGFPTDGEPVLIDVSASTTTNGMTGRLHARGERLPGPWLVDRQGRPSDDSGVLFREPAGAILPLGGSDLGHKGFGLALMVEALTSALGGFGRADGSSHWGAGVFLQLIDPDAFGGRDRFCRETGWLAQACRDTPVAPGSEAVRLPGAAGLARRREQLRDGVALYPGIMDALAPWAERQGIAMPAVLSGGAP